MMAALTAPMRRWNCRSAAAATARAALPASALANWWLLLNLSYSS